MLKYFQIWFLFRKNVHVCQNLCGISDTFELVDEVSAVFCTFLSFRKPPVLIKEKLLKYFFFAVSMTLMYDIAKSFSHATISGKSKPSSNSFYVRNRRRIELEDKANVVPSHWGTESLQAKQLARQGGRLNQPFVSKRQRQNS